MPPRRFDFNLNRPMTAAELLQVEGLVNSWVAAATPTAVSEMELDAARAAGATAMFGEKYEDMVRVVSVPGVSMELCGGEWPHGLIVAKSRVSALSAVGFLVEAPFVADVLNCKHVHARPTSPYRGYTLQQSVSTISNGCSLNRAGTHVDNTAEIGAFKIVSEGGVASGVRRIEAVAGQSAVEYMQGLDAIVKQLAGNLKVKGEDLPARISALQVRGTLALW